MDTVVTPECGHARRARAPDRDRSRGFSLGGQTSPGAQPAEGPCAGERLLTSLGEDLSTDDLVDLLRGTRRVGAASFVTGFGGAPTLAVNVTSVLTLQAATVLAVAAAYDELEVAAARG